MASGSVPLSQAEFFLFIVRFLGLLLSHVQQVFPLEPSLFL